MDSTEELLEHKRLHNYAVDNAITAAVNTVEAQLRSEGALYASLGSEAIVGPTNIGQYIADMAKEIVKAYD